MTYAVCVTFQIKEGQMRDFLPLMMANASTSMAKERECRQFDVATDPARPNEVFLYEVYTNGEAFAHHLTTDHFQRFDKDVAQMIASKDVKVYAQVGQ